MGQRRVVRIAKNLATQSLSKSIKALKIKNSGRYVVKNFPQKIEAYMKEIKFIKVSTVIYIYIYIPST